MAGPLALIGSDEFEPWEREVDLALLHGARSGDGSVLVLPTASAPDGPEVFRSWADKARRYYDELGAPVRIAEVPDRAAATEDRWVGAAADASLIYLSGGKPWFLAEALTDTPLWEAIHGAVRRGAALAGCSAGMCVLGELAPDLRGAGAAPAWVPAASLLPATLAVPHWNTVDDYLPGVREAVMNGAAGGRVVVCADERTALTFIDGVWRVFGEGAVFVAHDGAGRAYRAGDEVPLPPPPL